MPNSMKTSRVPSCLMLKEAAQFPKIVSHYLKVFDLEKMTSAFYCPTFSLCPPLSFQMCTRALRKAQR